MIKESQGTGSGSTAGGGGGGAAAGGIAQVATARKQQEVTELNGWKIGDKCRTIFLEDGAKYAAVISSLKPQTQSAIVTFVQYLNQQDTPLAFLERVEPAADAILADDVGLESKEKKRKKEGQVVINPTDAPAVVERKKRLLKKQKREQKLKEKEKIQEKKLKSWKSFQNSNAKRPGFKSAQLSSATSAPPPPPSGATRVRQKWSNTSSKISLPDPTADPNPNQRNLD